jgi:hypothetical protein
VFFKKLSDWNQLKKLPKIGHHLNKWIDIVLVTEDVRLWAAGK